MLQFATDSNIYLSDFKFLRMWPRTLFKKKDEKGCLRIKLEVKELHRPGVYILYKSDELYYVGRAAKLFDRLHSHANKVTDEYLCTLGLLLCVRVGKEGWHRWETGRTGSNPDRSNAARNK